VKSSFRAHSSSYLSPTFTKLPVPTVFYFFFRISFSILFRPLPSFSFTLVPSPATLPPLPLPCLTHYNPLPPFLSSLFLPQLLQKDPKKRLTIEQAFAHPFLQQNFEFSSPKAEASLEVVRTCAEDATTLRCHRQAVSILIDQSWW
jgi:serine/threonine protein kinase